MKKTVLLLFIFFSSINIFSEQQISSEDLQNQLNELRNTIDSLCEENIQYRSQLKLMNSLINADKFNEATQFYKDQTKSIQDMFSIAIAALIGITTLLLGGFGYSSYRSEKRNEQRTKQELDQIKQNQEELYGDIKEIREIKEKVEYIENMIQDSANMTEYSSFFTEALTYENQGKYKKAIESYDKAISLNPDDSYSYGNKGLVLCKLEKYEEAIQEFDKAIDLDPDEPDHYYNKSLALISLGRYEESIEACDQVIKMNPKDYTIYSNRGSNLRKLKRYEEAIQSYDQAIQLKPDESELYMNKAIVLMELEKYKDALDLLDHAVKLDDENPDVYYNLSCLFSLKNSADLALNYLNLSLDLGYKAKRKEIENDDDFKNIKDHPGLKALLDKFYPLTTGAFSDLEQH